MHVNSNSFTGPLVIGTFEKRAPGPVSFSEAPAGYPNKKSNHRKNRKRAGTRALSFSFSPDSLKHKEASAGERELQLKILTRQVHLYSDSLVSEELSFNVGYVVVEITRLTSPEVRVAVQACAEPPVLILTQQEKRRLALCSQGAYGQN